MLLFCKEFVRRECTAPSSHGFRPNAVLPLIELTKMKPTKLTALIALFFVTPFLTYAQIEVDNTTTPEEALAILLGGGVEVSNISFSGDANQLGSFLGANSNLGMEGGIVLGTGDVMYAQIGAPFGNNLGGGNFGVSDPDLALISGVNMHDAVILEFDFIALGEEITFDYIFASEEYNDFVCGTVNDAFGFFLSGPGIDGPFSNNAANLALIPNTDIPVTINSVNNGTPGFGGNPANCAAYSPNWTDHAVYFIDNTLNNGPDVIQFNGFTVMFQAQAPVQCEGLYHIKIAIADGGDTAYDSAVFLRQGSFDSPGIVISANLTNTVDDATIHENCGAAQITFERVGNVAQAYTLQITYAGTAVEGIHYEPLPTEVTFEPGESTVVIDVEPIATPEIQGVLELVIEVTTSGCDGDTTSFSLFITDDPLVGDLESGSPDCPGEEVSVVVSASGGVEPYEYLWNNGAQGAEQTVSFGQTETVSVSVTDACGTALELFDTVVVPQPPPLSFVLNELEPLDCIGVQELSPLVGGGSLPYSFEWYDDGVVVGNDASIEVVVDGDREVVLVVTDGCNIVTEFPISLQLVEHPPLALTQTDDPEICYGELTTLQVLAEGSFGPLNMTWEHNGSATWSTTVQPTRDTVYPYVITNGCGDTYSDSILVRVYEAIADFSFDFWSPTQISFTNLSQNNALNEWSFGDGSMSDEVDPIHDYLDLSTYTPVTLWVESEQGCRSVARDVIPPFMTAYVPNAFTPDNDGINEVFEFVVVGAKTFEFMVFNRWGEMVFTTTETGRFWNGSVNQGKHYSPDGVYFWVLEMTGFESNVERLTGSVTVIR